MTPPEIRPRIPHIASDSFRMDQSITALELNDTNRKFPRRAPIQNIRSHVKFGNAKDESTLRHTNHIYNSTLPQRHGNLSLSRSSKILQRQLLSCSKIIDWIKPALRNQLMDQLQINIIYIAGCGRVLSTPFLFNLPVCMLCCADSTSILSFQPLYLFFVVENLTKIYIKKC